MKPRPLKPELIEYLRPFVPLFVRQEQTLSEEARANKEWHMGQKEYEATPTLGGHEPATPLKNQNTQPYGHTTTWNNQRRTT